MVQLVKSYALNFKLSLLFHYYFAIGDLKSCRNFSLEEFLRGYYISISFIFSLFLFKKQLLNLISVHVINKCRRNWERFLILLLLPYKGGFCPLRYMTRLSFILWCVVLLCKRLFKSMDIGNTIENYKLKSICAVNLI